jgi:hypothetical protein
MFLQNGLEKCIIKLLAIILIKILAKINQIIIDKQANIFENSNKVRILDWG